MTARSIVASPPWWPYRCKQCARFVSNPVVTTGPPPEGVWFTDVVIADERGDCSRCGPGVSLAPLAWEDWFGWE